jgi:hypothetical protein
MIIHDEIDKNGKDVSIGRTREEAITYQKRAAFRAKGFIYSSDEEALQDYIVIYCARVTEDTSNALA